MLKDHLKDISHLTKEQIEAMCEPAILDEKDYVILSEKDWIEEDGIRYLKTPLKVRRIHWCFYTPDCSSIIAGVSDSHILYVFAFSTNQESEDRLCEEFDDVVVQYGYDSILGFSSEEVNCCAID